MSSSPGRTKLNSPSRSWVPTSSRSSFPSLSILAQPPVSVVDKNVDKKGTRKVAEGYLEYLYSPEGQEIAAKNYYRPTDEKVAAKYAGQFPKINLFTIDDAFGGWKKAYETHFKDGAHLRSDLRPRRCRSRQELRPDHADDRLSSISNRTHAGADRGIPPQVDR